MMTQIRTAALVAALAMPAGFAVAQSDTHTHSTKATAAHSGRQADPAAQQHLARMIILDNQGEIEVSRLAQQQAQNDDVKQFAQRMVQEHQQMVQQFQQATPGAGRMGSATATGSDAMASANEISASRTAEDSPRPGGDNQATMRRGEAMAERAAETADEMSDDAAAATSDAPTEVYGMAGGAAGAGGIATLDQFAQQYHQRKLQTTRQYLQSKQGTEFDKAYMGMQLMSHMHMLDMLQTAQGYMPQQAQQVLEQSIEHTQAHLEEARQIMEQLDQQG